MKNIDKILDLQTQIIVLLEIEEMLLKKRLKLENKLTKAKEEHLAQS